MDLISGDSDGNVWLFLNTGEPGSPVLDKGVKIKAGGVEIGSEKGDRSIYSKVHMADWDGDGLRDLLVGFNKVMAFYKNTGTPSAPEFAAPKTVRCPEGKFPSRPSPYVVDWDGDGTKDLLVGCESPQVMFYRNIGTDQAPRLDAGQPLDLRGPGDNGTYRWRIDVTDWNNDGKLDLVVGNCARSPEYRSTRGNIWLFLGE